MTVRTTAYTHTEAGGVNNAIGSRLRFGGDAYSAASDWSWLPLGTRFAWWKMGATYVIEDYGSALVGRKTIDLYMPSMGAVRKWGVRISGYRNPRVGLEGDEPEAAQAAGPAGLHPDDGRGVAEGGAPDIRLTVPSRRI